MKVFVNICKECYQYKYVIINYRVINIYCIGVVVLEKCVFGVFFFFFVMIQDVIVLKMFVMYFFDVLYMIVLYENMLKMIIFSVYIMYMYMYIKSGIFLFDFFFVLLYCVVFRYLGEL